MSGHRRMVILSGSLAGQMASVTDALLRGPRYEHTYYQLQGRWIDLPPRLWYRDDEVVEVAAGVLPQDENTPPQGEDTQTTRGAG